MNLLIIPQNFNHQLGREFWPVKDWLYVPWGARLGSRRFTRVIMVAADPLSLGEAEVWDRWLKEEVALRLPPNVLIEELCFPSYDPRINFRQ